MRTVILGLLVLAAAVHAACTVGAPCSAGLGACYREGSVTSCPVNGTAVCNATAGTPVTETCDDVDNDCDGVIDNGFAVGSSYPCTVGVGVCARVGPLRCNAQGGILCYAIPGIASPEVCNGLDDDCNGLVDDGIFC